MIGSPHEPANDRSTSETAKPEEWTQMPYSVSVGLPFWILRIAANNSGPSTHTSAITRIASCEESLRRSIR